MERSFFSSGIKISDAQYNRITISKASSGFKETDVVSQYNSISKISNGLTERFNYKT